MEISKVHAVFFSPTGNAKKVICTVADAVGTALGVPVAYDDFTLPQARQETRSYGPGDLVIFGTPTYAGRIPNKLLPFVQSGFQGNGALAVPVAVFGNRSYDNALMELRNELEAHGFHTVAGAGVPTEHVFSDKLAPGRPNADDLAELAEFGRKIGEKVARLTDIPTPIAVKGEDPVGPYYTPRDRHGNPINILPVKPKTSDACTQCGLCAQQCPLGAIDAEDAHQVPGKCMKCNRCVKHCPVGAKYFDDPNYLYHKSELEDLYSWPRKTPELFL